MDEQPPQPFSAKEEQTIIYVNEIPQGSRVKYALDKHNKNRFIVERELALPCPTNYGFIEGYMGEDGEELDCFLLNFNHSLALNSTMQALPLASARITNELGETETKIVCYPSFCERPSLANISDELYTIKDFLLRSKGEKAFQQRLVSPFELIDLKSLSKFKNSFSCM